IDFQNPCLLKSFHPWAPAEFYEWWSLQYDNEGRESQANLLLSGLLDGQYRTSVLPPPGLLSDASFCSPSHGNKQMLLKQSILDFHAGRYFPSYHNPLFPYQDVLHMRQAGKGSLNN